MKEHLYKAIKHSKVLINDLDLYIYPFTLFGILNIVLLKLGKREIKKLNTRFNNIIMFY